MERNPSEGTFSREVFIRSGVRFGAAFALFPTMATLASCGGGSSSDPSSDSGGSQTTVSESSPEETTPPETTMEESSEMTEETTEAALGGSSIAASSDVPPGEAVAFEDGGQPAVLVHLESGEFVAYSAVCTHQGCTVEFQPDSAELACPCHGSVFDPASGAAVVAGPASSPLPEIPVSESGGEVVRA